MPPRRPVRGTTYPRTSGRLRGNPRTPGRRDVERQVENPDESRGGSPSTSRRPDVPASRADVPTSRAVARLAGRPHLEHLAVLGRGNRGHPALASAVRLKHRLRPCLSCLKLVAANRWAVHARSDACPKRPIPTPQGCNRCGSARWPCLPCIVVAMVARHPAEDVAAALGVSVELVRREVRRHARRMRAKRQRDEEALAALTARFRAHLPKP